MLHFCQIRRFLSIVALTLLCASQVIAAPSLRHPEDAGMRAIGDGIFVGSGMSAGDRANIHHLVGQAQRQVAKFYGGLAATPNVVFCDSNDCYRDFGAMGLGFSDGTNIVIAPNGQRTAIIAHELAHVELSTRLGGFDKVMELIPQWFDEGQAVLVSAAAEFNDAAWLAATAGGRHAPALSSLASMADWNRVTGPGGEGMQFSYGTARQEVARWFAATGPRGLLELINALRRNEAFASAYARAETEIGTGTFAAADRSPAAPQIDSVHPQVSNAVTDIPGRAAW